MLWKYLDYNPNNKKTYKEYISYQTETSRMDIRLTKTVGTDITNLYFSGVNTLQFIIL